MKCTCDRMRPGSRAALTAARSALACEAGTRTTTFLPIDAARVDGPVLHARQARAGASGACAYAHHPVGRERAGRDRRAVRVEDRVQDEALVLRRPGAVPGVEAEHDRVPGAERLVDDRRPPGQVRVRVDLVAVAVAESGRAAAVARGRVRRDRRRRGDRPAVARERGGVERRVAARLAIDPAARVEAPADGIRRVPRRVERRARRADAG